MTFGEEPVQGSIMSSKGITFTFVVSNGLKLPGADTDECRLAMEPKSWCIKEPLGLL